VNPRTAESRSKFMVYVTGDGEQTVSLARDNTIPTTYIDMDASQIRVLMSSFGEFSNVVSLKL
jgi:hypothetical protein